MRILGVCAAQGALLFSLRKYVIGNIEPRAVFHTKNEEQWKLNFKDTPFERCDSIFKNSEVDVIIGSPSCGHSSVFSYSRKKSLGEPKTDPTLNLYLDCVKKFKPKIFLLENLPKLMDLIPQPEWEYNLPDYELIVHCHSVIVFGNSQQSRKRLILIGIRKDSGINKKYFKRIYPVSKPLKNEEILGKVRHTVNYRENDDKKLAMYHFNDKTKQGLTVSQVRKLWNTEFKDNYKWPMKTLKMKTLPGVYRNRLNTYPLTARPSSRQFNFYGEIMGLEEYRIIMGFPKKFRIFFDESERGYWLNKGRNTLTKGSVFEVGKWFGKQLKKAFS